VTDQDEQRSEALAVFLLCGCIHEEPYLTQAACSFPSDRLQCRTARPLRDGGLDTARKGAFENQMPRRLQVAIAKLTEITVRPASAHESVCAPQPVLVNQPQVHFAACRCPSLPYHRWSQRSLSPDELHVVCRFRRVVSVRCKDPTDAVRLLLRDDYCLYLIYSSLVSSSLERWDPWTNTFLFPCVNWTGL
jgi:hypothetical protein